MIKLVKVKKTYGSGDTLVEALKECTLTLEDKKFIAIIGKSGSGKTTLMNLIGALDTPSSGKIFFNEDEITSLNKDELSNYRNKKIGYIFQSFYLDEKDIVLHNVCMPLIIAGVNKNEREERAKIMLLRLDIFEKMNFAVNELSGGQKQRVAIARALINNPEVVLADEPTGNLDSENGKEVMQLLRKIVTLGKTVILVTHNLEDAKNYADKIIQIQDGVVQCDSEIK